MRTTYGYVKSGDLRAAPGLVWGGAPSAIRTRDLLAEGLPPSDVAGFLAVQLTTASAQATAKASPAHFMLPIAGAAAAKAKWGLTYWPVPVACRRAPASPLISSLRTVKDTNPHCRLEGLTQPAALPQASRDGTGHPRTDTTSECEPGSDRPSAAPNPGWSHNWRTGGPMPLAKLSSTWSHAPGRRHRVVTGPNDETVHDRGANGTCQATVARRDCEESGRHGH